MRKILFKMTFLFSLLIALTLLSNGANAEAQKTSPLQSVTFDATLVNMSQKAQKKSATVEVQVSGIELIDPDKTGEQAKDGQGHLHYKLDIGPIIATTSTKLSFHDLASGKHMIVVQLAGNDHKPLGPQKSLEVTIP